MSIENIEVFGDINDNPCRCTVADNRKDPCPHFWLCAAVKIKKLEKELEEPCKTKN